MDDTNSGPGRDDPAHSDVGERTLVCSIPKSGTYLLNCILRNLGIADTGLHISKNETSIYRNGSMTEYRADPHRFKASIPVSESLPQVRAGQFAVSHLPCDSETIGPCQEFRVIFLHRDLRDCLISYMRFLADTGRDDSANSNWIKFPDGPQRLARFMEIYDWYFKNWAAPLIDWQRQPNALTLKFETLVGDDGLGQQVEAMDLLRRHIGIDKTPIELVQTLSEALDSPTMTWSGSRTNRDRYWSHEVQRRFVKMGGEKLNHRIGYGSRIESHSVVPALARRIRMAFSLVE